MIPFPGSEGSKAAVLNEARIHLCQGAVLDAPRVSDERLVLSSTSPETGRERTLMGECIEAPVLMRRLRSFATLEPALSATTPLFDPLANVTDDYELAVLRLVWDVNRKNQERTLLVARSSCCQSRFRRPWWVQSVMRCLAPGMFSTPAKMSCP